MSARRAAWRAGACAPADAPAAAAYVGRHSVGWARLLRPVLGPHRRRVGGGGDDGDGGAGSAAPSDDVDALRQRVADTAARIAALEVAAGVSPRDYEEAAAAEAAAYALARPGADGGRRGRRGALGTGAAGASSPASSASSATSSTSSDGSLPGRGGDGLVNGPSRSPRRKGRRRAASAPAPPAGAPPLGAGALGVGRVKRRRAPSDSGGGVGGGGGGGGGGHDWFAVFDATDGGGHDWFAVLDASDPELAAGRRGAVALQALAAGGPPATPLQRPLVARSSYRPTSPPPQVAPVTGRSDAVAIRARPVHCAELPLPELLLSRGAYVGGASAHGSDGAPAVVVAAVARRATGTDGGGSLGAALARAACASPPLDAGRGRGSSGVVAWAGWADGWRALPLRGMAQRPKAASPPSHAPPPPSLPSLSPPPPPPPPPSPPPPLSCVACAAVSGHAALGLEELAACVCGYAAGGGLRGPVWGTAQGAGGLPSRGGIDDAGTVAGVGLSGAEGGTGVRSGPAGAVAEDELALW